MKKWLSVILLASAQFIMVLDSTVMNVSMAEVTTDLNTSIAALQTAITVYTLTMAAFMLLGGKLGDKWGRITAFRIGAVVYGIGSLITALSPGILALFLGWSIIEGLGAVLVIPAIVSLIAYNYKGKDRLVAFAIIGCSAGIAAAAGPLIGGFFTTFLSWRYVFAAETAIMLVILFGSRWIGAPAKPIGKLKLDVPSVFLSSIGLSLLVFGILQSKTWGWVTPMAIPEIAGHPIAPFGISIVPYLIIAGLILLGIFYSRQKKLEKEKRNPLLRVSVLSIKQLRSGLWVLLAQYFVIASLFFVVPVYLQMVLGFDALTTGIKILPLSVGLIIFSIVGSRMVTKFAPRRIVRIGQIFLFVGAMILVAAVNPELKGFVFGFGMFLMGAGLGILASQISNLNMSTVDNDLASEVGGLQGTLQNLGSSLGTALIGSVLIASLTTGFVQQLYANPNIPTEVTQEIQQETVDGVEIVSATQVEQYALDQGLTQTEAENISEDYKAAQIQSLRESLFLIAVFSLFSLLLATHLPKTRFK